MSEWQHPLVTAIRGQLRRQELAANRILSIVGAVAPESAPSTTKRVAMFALASVSCDRRILQVHAPIGSVLQSCATCVEYDEDDMNARAVQWPCSTVREVAAKFPDLDPDLLR